MDGTGPQRPLGDSQLDRDIESALSIEPSPEFLARARARIAAEPDPSWWRLALWRRGLQPMVALCLVGIVLTIVIPQWMRDEGAQPRTVAANVSDTANEAASGLQASLVRLPIRMNPIRRPSAESPADSPHTVPLQLSPVLFAEEDQRAFGFFVTAVAEGRVPEDVANTDADSGGPVALAIEPLVIDPLPVLARVQQQGEGQW